MKFKCIPKATQKLAFGCVSYAVNFLSSLAPCACTMAARSRQKIYAAALPKFQLLNYFRYILPSMLVIIFIPLFAQDAQQTVKTKPTPTSIEYLAKDYSYLYGMPGFTDALLKMHFQLYQGYVKNTNLLLSRFKELELQDRDQTYDYGALKRRLGWEWDGMRLHEFYFENLGGHEPLDKSAALFQRIVKDFGSYDAWKKSFTSTGLIRGIGWVILYRDPQSGRLFNTWINEHDLGHLSGGSPLLVMDVFEHAYITQYGLDRGKYISAFFDNIDWAKVAKRYNDATGCDTMH